MNRYSQSLEQDYILDYFKGSVGTFLDIGANDGITFSNTRALAELGFSGVLVEPAPKAFEKLKSLYHGQKGFYLYPFAISSKNGTAPLEVSGSLCSPADTGLVSTFHQHEKDRFKRMVQYETVEVKTFKWKTFYNRLTIKKFDMISIDVESDEMTFLPDMDLTDCKLLVIEHNSKPELKKAYIDITSKFGLDKIIYESGENIIIVRS